MFINANSETGSKILINLDLVKTIVKHGTKSSVLFTDGSTLYLSNTIDIVDSKIQVRENELSSNARK